ncbi:MAG: hypothetical protein ACRDN8_12740 [Thermoleophilaceae bacterium]
MAAKVQMRRAGAWRRAASLALLVAGLIAGSAVVPAPAAAVQTDQPAIEQYTDPFAPLGTGRRAPAWNPFSPDFGARVPERVRRLARVEGGPTLEMLLAQLETERARTGRRRSTAGPTGAPRGVAAGKVEQPTLLSSAASAVFDGGSPRGALLVVGLTAVAASGAVAVWARRRRGRAG